MRKIRAVIAAVAAMLMTAEPSPACTSVIVSGKSTPDGRPLMWKNRDTGIRDDEDINGSFMRMALEKFASVEEFEEMKTLLTDGESQVG